MSSGSRRTSPTMPSTRVRSSMDSSRHTSRTSSNAGFSRATQRNSMPLQQPYSYVTTAPAQIPLLTSCLPLGDDAFYPSNDGSYIPASSISPAALTFLDNITTYDIDISRTSPPSSASTTSSPPMNGADMYQSEMYAVPDMPLGMDPFIPYSDPWVTNLPLTPPADPIFDIPDMFQMPKNDQVYQVVPDMGTECEYLGLSKVQFSTRPAPRSSQPRLIRSASERTPESSPSGSPKDEPLERTKNNPRSDRRYDAKADKDGVYHCPYASEGCNHKPTKQKCIYAKNLDSHLKPYTCKYTGSEDCRTLRFSSNACLFRHEREMHGLHNHGINPYLCKFPGCERARDDNGFPRRWNQRDHMKRVHGWEEPDNDDDRAHNESCRRRRGPSTSSSVPMKRNGSARAHPYLPGQTRSTGAPRYSTQNRRELHAQNIMMPGMTIDSSHFTPHPLVDPSYGPGLFMTGHY